MSSGTAKAARRAQREQAHELVLQAHDRLHHDDVEGCHTLLHAALGDGTQAEVAIAPMAHLASFDLQFQQLCQRHGVAAAFVAEDPQQPGRMMTGGVARITAALAARLRA